MATHVIFFDGYCGVCDWIVSQLMPSASVAGFKFAPLQGETFRQIEAHCPHLRGVDSVVFVENFGDAGGETAKVKGTAALAILRHLSGKWVPLRLVFEVVPGGVRDFFYDLIAKNRTRIAGRRETCRLPTPEERELFLP